MTTEQYRMITKMLHSNSYIKLGKYTFKIELKNKEFGIYECNEYYSGTKTILTTGTFEECYTAAIDCIGLMYGIIS